MQFVAFMILILLLVTAVHPSEREKEYLPNDLFYNVKTAAEFPLTVVKWETLEQPRKFSLLTVDVEHNSAGTWYVPAQHQKNSIGKNLSQFTGIESYPQACTIQFYGLALADTLKGFMNGGIGYLYVQHDNEFGKTKWYGYDTDRNKVYCFYHTNMLYGSDFQTFGIAIQCSLPMDNEIGSYIFRHNMVPGYFCRTIAQYTTLLQVRLRPSNFSFQDPQYIQNNYEYPSTQEIESNLVVVPLAKKLNEIQKHEEYDHRPNSVCTVQTFRNRISGFLLYLFVKYYTELGWRVIVYDRFGFHRTFISELLGTPGFDYHPYTVFQLVNPQKYNSNYAAKTSFESKYYYENEKFGGYKGTQADTADQDQDKTKTYDYARLEYAHLKMMLFIDIDELFFCPQAGKNMTVQRIYQQQIMNEFSLLGIEEMRFVRLNYAALAPKASYNRSHFDYDAYSSACIQKGYSKRSLLDMMNCWSSAARYDGMPKSADFAGKCPFHYNHWSCDGMKGGGRDLYSGKEIPRCRCKVAFDMMNGFTFHVRHDRCHLIHLNDNRYRYFKKQQKIQSHGNLFAPNPVYNLLKGDGEGIASAEYFNNKDHRSHSNYHPKQRKRMNHIQNNH